MTAAGACPARVKVDGHGYCPGCRKIMYGTRALARRARRDMPWTKGMRAYKCPVGMPCFHVGHLDDEVRRGEQTLRELRRTWREA